MSQVKQNSFSARQLVGAAAATVMVYGGARLSSSLAFTSAPAAMATSRLQFASRGPQKTNQESGKPLVRAHARSQGASSYAALGAVAALVPLACRSAATRTQRKRRRTQCAAYTSAPQTYEGAPIGPPPDLPSLLLKNRIVYLGTPITAEVTELIVAQLLYLNYESADKPVTMYINSTGSTIKNNTRYVGESKVGLETDAFAIADCMRYIKPQVMTIGVGQAYGSAAMLLGLGTKGKRFALPNATIMLSEPREPPARGPRQASDIKILAREVLNNRSTMSELLATATGKSKDDIVKDTSRCYYMSPDEAVEYGLIDKVLTTDKLKEVGQELPSFVSAL